MAMRPIDRLPTVRAKLGSVIVFAVAVTILIMYVAIGFVVRKSDRDREFRAAVAEASGIQALSFGPTGSPLSPTKLARLLANAPNPILVVDAADHRLVGETALRIPQDSVSRILSGSASFDTGRIGALEFVGTPVTREKRIVGAVYVGYRVERNGFWGALTGTARFVRSLWWQFLVAGAVSAFVALFLARILARGLTKPLRDMANAARQMARGDYAQRVEVRSRDEVGQLATAFNRMAGEMEGLEKLRRDLVANVSHELKTPISALRAHLENLLDGVEEPNPEVLSVMLRQSERLTRLIEQLLELSRIESGDVPLSRERVPLSPLIERVISEVRVAWPSKDVAVETVVADPAPTVDADRERIHQVLFNLLDNAFRFTASGGHVRVRAARRAAGMVEVTVQDTGIGIPRASLPLVFERFYRVDPSRSREDGGTGIGLAIARSVIEAHGGRIWAASEPGAGSRFTFVLPAWPEAPAAAAPPVEAVPADRAGAAVATERALTGVGRGPKEER